MATVTSGKSASFEQRHFGSLPVDYAVPDLTQVQTESYAEFLQLERMVNLQGFGSKSITQKKWRQWQQAYPDMISSLVFIYRNSNRQAEAEMILNDWVQRNPSDKNALKLLEEVRTEG